MNKQEAIEAMKEGKRVTSQYFTRDEWMTMEHGRIFFEDGCVCWPREFWCSRDDKSWDNGYSLWVK